MADEDEEIKTITEYGEGWEAELTRQGKETPPPWAVKFFEAIYAALSRAFEVLWVFFFRRLLERLLDLGKWLRFWSEKGENELWSAAFNSLKEGGVLAPELVERLLRLQNIPAPLGSALNILLLMNFLKEYVSSLGTVSFAPMVQRLNKEYRPNLPDPSAMVKASFVAPEMTGVAREVLKKHGLTDEHIDMMYIASYALTDIQSVMQLYMRKEIDKEKMYERMRELGFTDTRTDEMLKLTQVIPPIQDIITMLAKEAFEPDQVALYGLEDEFPTEQAEWLEKQGLSEFWQKKYWAAHWTYPGPGQVLEMLHRGLLSEHEVSEYYRVVEMPPYWREKLMQISFHPYTRVDTRRMHGMGVLTDEEIVKAYLEQGYDQEHAEKMAEFTIRYNSDERVKITRAQIVKAYRNTMVSRDEAKELLRSIKISNDVAEWYLMSADFDEQLDLQDLYVAAAKDRYIDNLWDDPTTRAALMKLNLSGARIEALMERWSTMRRADSKLPSKTDLDKFLKAKIINTDTYRLEMYRLGYPFNYTDWYLKLNQGVK
uniref:Uncharacterized protein n=1 Tax=viral metagenome TaxID=1070528 RepID=A0A6H1ZPP2_9ZZZZ